MFFYQINNKNCYQLYKTIFRLVMPGSTLLALWKRQLIVGLDKKTGSLLLISKVFYFLVK